MTLHVSTWAEDRILDYFWMMVRQDVDRIALLRQLALVAVKRPPEWSPADVRLDSLGAKQQRPVQCFGCRTGDRRLYWHHVIGVQNGGSNTWGNQVAICLRCHASIHPWLNADEPGQRKRGGWTAVGDMLRELAQP